MRYVIASETMMKVNPKRANEGDTCDNGLSEMLSNVGQRKMHCQFLLATSKLCKQSLVPRHVKSNPTTNKVQECAGPSLASIDAIHDE